MSRSSLNGAMVSSVMYRARCTAHYRSVRQDRSDETNDRIVSGEDANNVGPALGVRARRAIG